MGSPTATASGSRVSSRTVAAAFLSALVPGLGQWFAGARRKGRTLLIIDVVILATLLFFFRDRISIATAFVRPTSLALLMIVNISLLAYRAWAADDAYRAAADRGPGGARWSTPAGVVAAVVIGVVLVLPHAAFAYYDLVQYDLITSVFASPTTTTSTVTEPGVTPVDTASAGSTPGAETVPATTEPPVIWDGLARLNILLLGGDFGAGRTGIRTDTMITVSIDPATGETAMFSVPRNWTYAPLPVGMGIWDCNCYPELINELWTMGERHPEAFPGPGTPAENAVKGVVSEFLGIPIHYYALVNLDGFVDIIDSIGGIDIYVPQNVVDEEYPHEDGTLERIEIDSGWQHLDGHLALAYARTRHQDSDYFRMNRQRCVLEAVLDQTDPADLLLNFGRLADVIKRSVSTDIPIDALPQLVELLPSVERDEILSLRLIPPDYHLRFRDDGKPGRIANIDLVHEHVELVISDPERAIRELGLDTLDDVCGELAQPASATTSG